MLCSGLSQNKTLKWIDITNNPIPDTSLKKLLALLFINETIIDIKYTLTKPKNLDTFSEFQKVEDKLTIDELYTKFEIEQKPKIPLWQKVIFPIWLFRSFLRSEHEAFRFKYDSEALRIIENESMDRLTISLYLNAIGFYCLCFLLPFLLKNECGAGIKYGSHIAYGSFSLFNLFLEIYIVLRMERRIHDHNFLHFNKWHWVELFMGQIIRLDFYMDVCIAVIFLECKLWRMFIPVMVFMILSLIYPIYKQLSLLQKKTNLKHILPKIERNCKLAFIRENLLIATVLDSFSIDNFEVICGKAIVFARIVAVLTFFVMDLPQFIIHLVFLFSIHDIPHADATVILSLVATVFGFLIAIFNLVATKPNAFDPILL